jgi:large subunit ribosomal protein L13
VRKGDIKREWYLVDAEGRTLGRLASEIAKILRGKHKPTYVGYPGGLKSISLRDQLQKHPTRVLEAAVRGMLPKNRLGRAMRKKLKVYAGDSHPHQAQQPKILEL